MNHAATFGVGLSLLGGTAWANESAPTVDKCEREFGTLAVAESDDAVLQRLNRFQLGSPTAMLRMIAQESGCFAVVERGAGMQTMQRERALAAGGQLTADANIGGGQMQVADFVMTAVVQFADDTGGFGGTLGSLGGLLGRGGAFLGALAGGVKFKEAQTSLLVSDVRSGIQVASGEGQASKMSFSLGGWGWGGLGWAAAGGYSKTPEGKLIAASLLDNFNKVVASIRAKPHLVRARSEASVSNAAMSTAATPQTTSVIAPAGAAAIVATPATVVSPRVVAPLTVAPQVVTPRVITLPQVVVAPSVIVTQSDNVVPSTMVGSFSGQFGGGHSGVLSLLVSVNGRVSGIVQSAAAGGSVPVNGVADANGIFVLIGTNQGTTAQFSGRIDTQSGAMAGTWMVVGQNVQGTFSGKRD